MIFFFSFLCCFLFSFILFTCISIFYVKAFLVFGYYLSLFSVITKYLPCPAQSSNFLGSQQWRIKKWGQEAERRKLRSAGAFSLKGEKICSVTAATHRRLLLVETLLPRNMIVQLTSEISGFLGAGTVHACGSPQVLCMYNQSPDSVTAHNTCD